MILAMTLNGDFCLRLTFTLLHFLWQGMAIALLALAARALLGRAGAAVRCWLLVAALGAMALCPPVTFLALAPRVDSRQMENASGKSRAPFTGDMGGVRIPPSAGVSAAPMAPEKSWPGGETIASRTHLLKERLFGFASPEACRRAAPYVATGYFAGVLLMLARLLLALRGGRGLRGQARPVTEPALLSSLQRMAEAVKLRATPAVAWCRRVAVPTVVGILKPAILLPLSLSSGLSAGQVEMLLLHELAHLRRHDHLINLVQWVIETVLFFHPAVWIISRRIRAERELACDDMVVAAGVEQAHYVESLLRMAELSRHTPSPVQALSLGSHGPRFSGFGQRVLRLIEGREATENPRPSRLWPLGVALLVLVMGFGATVWIGEWGAATNPPTREFQLEVDRIEQQSPDGHRLLLADGEILLRLEAAQVASEKLAGGRLRVRASGSESQPLKVGVPLTGGAANKARFERIHAIAASNPKVQTFYILQKGWDRELVEIPTAIVVPQALTESKDWRQWKRIKNVVQLEHVDALGRKYLLNGLGWGKVGTESVPVIPSLQRFRPDGTLEAHTTYNPEAQPGECYFYDRDGTTRIGYIWLDWKGVAPKVWGVTWRDSEGHYHQYAPNSQGVIRWDWAGKLDKQGMFSTEKLLSGGSKWEKASFQVDREKCVRGMESPLH